MDNNELLLQIAAMMEDQTRMITSKIENDVTKKIETLFDGYKLTHEKQYELERKVEALEHRLEALENKTA